MVTSSIKRKVNEKPNLKLKDIVDYVNDTGRLHYLTVPDVHRYIR